MTEPGFLDRAVAIGGTLLEGLKRVCAPYPSVIQEIRGVGLLLGLKCGIPNTEMIEKLRTRGLLTAGAGDNVDSFLPPLIIETAKSITLYPSFPRRWPRWLHECIIRA